MKTAIYGVVGTLFVAAVVALINLYSQVQVQQNEIGHLVNELDRLRSYYVAN